MASRRHTPREAEILSLLAEHGPMFGPELVAYGEHLASGFLTLTLRRLEVDGLIASKVVAGAASDGLARRVYWLVGEGEHDKRV